MQEQHATSDDRSEPPRGRSIPDDFIWDPELRAWYPPPAESPGWDAEAWHRRLEAALRSAAENPAGLISRDELLAAGALDVPPAWRKSLGRKKPPRGQRELFSDMDEDDTPLPEKQPPALGESDGNEPSDELP